MYNEAARLLQRQVAYKEEVAFAMNKGLIGSLSEFVPNISAFEDLKSGANLNIISDKNVIKALNSYYQRIDGINKILSYHSNNMAIVWHSSHRNKFATGWIHGTMNSDRFKKGMDQDVYMNVDISSTEVFDQEMKFNVYNDALTFISSNYRTLELYNLIDQEIGNMHSVLNGKCQK